MCAGALVSWLWEEAHVLKIMGSNPSILHGHFSHYFAVKIVLMKTENKRERGRGWAIKKHLHGGADGQCVGTVTKTRSTFSTPPRRRVYLLHLER